ncbi:MAG: hypothetical protein Q8M94_03755, partial [Ignavibacteria bacterium]|nr:hypothetical protein [Ignavibacteria bacterium]
MKKQGKPKTTKNLPQKVTEQPTEATSANKNIPMKRSKPMAQTPDKSGGGGSKLEIVYFPVAEIVKLPGNPRRDVDENA